MEINEQLIQQITRLVIEEMRKVKEASLISTLDLRGQQAMKGTNVKEVVIGIGPSFLNRITKTINGLEHRDVLREIKAGIEEEGMIPRVLQVFKTSDVAFIGKEAASLSGSGIGIGLQSKGTVLIHQRDLYPLTNLELFPQAPLLSLETYREIGKNAARYAKGVPVVPIAVQNDHMVRPKYQVKAALMHIRETEEVKRTAPSIELNNL